MQQQFCGYLISWLMIGRLSRYMCDYSAPEGKLADCCSWSWWAASLIQIRTATEEPVSWHQSIDEPTGKELKGGPLDWDTGLTLKKRSQITNLTYVPWKCPSLTRGYQDQDPSRLWGVNTKSRPRSRQDMTKPTPHCMTPANHSDPQLKTLLHLPFLLPFMLYLSMCTMSSVLIK